MKIKKEIKLYISGLGIIMYSDFAVAHIAEGENYFSSHYQYPDKVAAHVMEGSLVGFCTGSPGDYILKFQEGYPSEKEMRKAEFGICLGIEIRENKMYVRDVYDLMDWKNECPTYQSIKLNNGFYHITLIGNCPKSGIIGDHQTINFYLNKLDEMPKLRWYGVPTYCS
jgi:hypothetical protein